MQRWCGKLRPSSLSAIDNAFSRSTVTSQCFSTHVSRSLIQNSISKSIFNSLPVARHQPLDLGFRSPLSPFLTQMTQSRGFASRKKENKRTPITPAISKLKKFKIKAYSSFKFRFRTMNDGKIRRWREGKRHNAHLKSKKAKRRLRKPEIVPSAYAKGSNKIHVGPMIRRL